MSRARKFTPSYLKHHNGQARAAWYLPGGGRRFKLLPGKYNSPESLEAFARLQLELAVRPAQPPRVTDQGPSVAEILLPYIRHATAYYGAESSELTLVRAALRPVRDLYASTPAAEFGPLALSAVREAMVRRKWTRKQINRQVGRVVRCFKWAAAEELIPITLHAALKSLTPLRKGKTEAPESPPRLPADSDHVATTLPFLPPHVRAIVELMRLTGARPGEIVGIPWGDVDRSGAVWVYSPDRHKTAHRGKTRTILFGPAAQAVIVAHLGGKVLAPTEFLFSPRRQRDERYAQIRATRKSKVPPSQVARKKAKPKREPGEKFTHRVLCNAVGKACGKAGVPKWSPYRLRHLVAAEVRAGFGIEHAKALLGHAGTGMTDHYAKGADKRLAEEVAAKAG